MKKIIAYTVLMLMLSFSVQSFALQNDLITSKPSQQPLPKGYLVMNYDITNKGLYKKYIKSVNQLWSKHKGELIIYSEDSKPAEGSLGSVISVVEFPSAAAAEKCYNSPAFNVLKKLRSASTKGIVLIAQSSLPALSGSSEIPHGYMIANYEIKNQAVFQKYMDAAGTLAPKYNGAVTIFDFKAKVLEGIGKSVFGVAEFKSLKEAEKFYNSPEYSAARRFRITSTEGAVMLLQGSR